MRLLNSFDLPPLAVRPADDTSRTELNIRWVISVLDNSPVFKNKLEETLNYKFKTK